MHNPLKSAGAINSLAESAAGCTSIRSNCDHKVVTPPGADTSAATLAHYQRLYAAATAQLGAQVPRG